MLQECRLVPRLKGTPALVRNQFILTELIRHITHRTQSFTATEKEAAGEQKSKKMKEFGANPLCPLSHACDCAQFDDWGGGRFKTQLILAFVKLVLLKCADFEADYHSSLCTRLITIAWGHVMLNSCISFLFLSVYKEKVFRVEAWKPWKETDKDLLKTCASVPWSAWNLDKLDNRLLLETCFTLPQTPLATALWQPLTSPNPSYNFTPQITALSGRHPADTSYWRQLGRAGISP